MAKEGWVEHAVTQQLQCGRQAGFQAVHGVAHLLARRHGCQRTADALRLHIVMEMVKEQAGADDVCGVKQWGMDAKQSRVNGAM